MGKLGKTLFVLFVLYYIYLVKMDSDRKVSYEAEMGECDARRRELEALYRTQQDEMKLTLLQMQALDPVCCIKTNNFEALKITINFYRRDDNDNTLVMLAAKLQRWEMLDWLLQKIENNEIYQDIAHRNNDGEQLIHILAQHNQGDTMQRIIDLGADVHATVINGWTPLHIVVINGAHTNLAPLLDAGANMNAKNDKGYTPLELSSKSMLQHYAKWKAANLSKTDFYAWFSKRDKKDQLEIMQDLSKIVFN
jgi:hypothetical protein